MNDIAVIHPSNAETTSTFDAASFWKEFHHGMVTVGGVRLHYVEGGSGTPLLLLPGWPQSWYAWRRVMPMLTSAGRRVIALDPRGIGDSDRPSSGYGLETVAADVHGFIDTLGLAAGGGLDVVGHDVGVWIGYALASHWPGDVKRLVLCEAAVPGLSPPTVSIPSAEANVKTWHFAFNRLDDLPELLIQGREREFLAWLFRMKSVKPWAIEPADLDEYVRVLAAPGALRAALSYYRAAFSPEGLEQSRARAEQGLTLPVLALGAEHGVGDTLAKALSQTAAQVQGGVIKACGHYVPEECPRTLVDELLRFFAVSEG